MRTVTLPAVDTVLKVLPESKIHFELFDNLGEFTDKMQATKTGYHGENMREWCGGMNKAESLLACRNGDLSSVPIADEMMTQIEDTARFHTKSFRQVQDVVGGIPNVPAFLAGHPLNMRRRERTNSQYAPLVIVADLTSSGGISAKDVLKRGCAILALVRLLTDTRPVELWAGAELDCDSKYGKGSNFAIFTKMDTAPLDLARVAHFITHASVPRAVHYAYGQHKYDSPLRWAYGNTIHYEMQRNVGAESFARVLNPGGDVLYIPPIYAKDNLISNPTAWIKDMINRYGWNTDSEE